MHESSFHGLIPPKPLTVDDIACPNDDLIKGLVPLVISSSGASLRILRDCPEWITHLEKIYAAKNRSASSKRKKAVSYDNLASRNAAKRVRDPTAGAYGHVQHARSPVRPNHDVESINDESDGQLASESDEALSSNRHKNKAAYHAPMLQRPKIRPYEENGGRALKDTRRDKCHLMDNDMPRERQRYTDSHRAAHSKSRSTVPQMMMGRRLDADEYSHRQVDYDVESPSPRATKRTRYEDENPQYKVASHKKSKSHHNLTTGQGSIRRQKNAEAGPSCQQYDYEDVDETWDDLEDD